MVKAAPYLLLSAAAAVWAGAAFSHDTLTAGLILAAPLLLLAILHRPVWGLGLLVLVHPVTTAYGGPIYRMGNFGLPALALGSWCLLLLAERRSSARLPAPLILWFVAFVFWMCFTSFLGMAPGQGLMTCFRYVLLAAILTAFMDLMSKEGLGKTLLAHVFILTPIAAYGIWQATILGPQILGGEGLPVQRWYSIYENPNKLGVIMGHGIVILMAYAVVYSARTVTLRRGLILAALLGVLLVLSGGLLVSISRSSYLYVLCAAVILTLSRRATRLPALGVLVGASSSILLFFPAMAMYALRPGAGFSFRDSLWLTGWRVLTENPWTGIGAGANSFESIRAAYLSTEAHRGLLTTTSGQAHNVFLTKGAEMGWIGLALTLILFVLGGSRLRSSIRAYQEGDWVSGAAAAGFVGLSVRAMFESGVTLGAGHLSDSLMFFLFVLVLLAPRRLGQSPSPPEPPHKAPRSV